jgi:magnesium transporter
MISIFYLDKKTLKKGNIKSLNKIKRKKLWIDISGIKKSEAENLKKVFNLHDVTKEDLFPDGGRVKVEEFDHYLFCTFFGLKEKRSSLNLCELDFVIGKNFLITSHAEKLDTYEKLKKNKEKLSSLLDYGLESVFHYLLDHEIDEFPPILEKLDDNIIKIDENIALHPNINLMNDILKIKKKIVVLKKITLPQREKILSLSKREYKFIPESSKPYFRDMYDHSIRIYDIVEDLKESISSTFDAHMTSVAHTQNEVMKVLSIIATIALPLTVISGIYGTNFEKIPGIKSESGFMVMVFSMGLFMVLMALFFKKRRWF